ncbi:hypothetical protein PAPYR_11280 [Paratrimastix pyriformis]|uniref:Uncharacterized protein n=1 Tax=Paratrimastix pyriformis TaxID=342808 RepID=A0ABQ8U473_9EUKA|nr:hypothetical protein PAPYR_11280 [Paratrimastix pyriformis]
MPRKDQKSKKSTVIADDDDSPSGSGTQKRARASATCDWDQLSSIVMTLASKVDALAAAQVVAPSPLPAPALLPPPPPSPTATQTITTSAVSSPSTRAHRATAARPDDLWPTLRARIAGKNFRCYYQSLKGWLFESQFGEEGPTVKAIVEKISTWPGCPIEDQHFLAQVADDIRDWRTTVKGNQKAQVQRRKKRMELLAAAIPSPPMIASPPEDQEAAIDSPKDSGPATQLY